MDLQLKDIKNKPIYKSKKTIDLANVVYDEEFVSLLNSLSSYIKNFYSITTNIIKDLYNNSLIIDNNSIYSKCLINEINYNTKEKIKQLNERIEAICSTKKIIEKNILLIDSNLSKFFNDSKKIFKNMKLIRNSKINYAIDTSANYDYNNSMSNIKLGFEKEDFLMDKNEKENYYKRRNNSLCNEREKPLSFSRIFKRNEIFPSTRKGSETSKRYNNLKLNYFNHINNSNNYNNNIINNNSAKIRNKLFNNKKNSSENIFSSSRFRNNCGIKKTLESSPEMSTSKSSFNNFYINQNSNINLNNNNFNNNNNNLELSYKVIEFLSLLSNITKNNSTNNPYMNKTFKKFETTKKNLFELSKKYIEQNNKKEINNRVFQNNNIQSKQANKSKKDLQLILMNNNITNIRKEIENKDLIDKIKNLTKNIKNIEKENKNLKIINNNIKKKLINNNLLLSKNNNLLNLAKEEKNEFINQINILQKDNDSLRELIFNNKNNDSKIEKDTLILKEKEKIIQNLKNQLNEKNDSYERNINDKNNEIKNTNTKISELNKSLKKLENIIKEKEAIINGLEIKFKNEETKKTKKNEFTKEELIYENIEQFSFIKKKIKTKNINEKNKKIKNVFGFDELILEKMEPFSYISKNKKYINNSIENNIEIIDKLEKKIKELSNKINEKEKEIKKYKNENSLLKSFVEKNKNNEGKENDEKNKSQEEIKKLEEEKQKLIEEKNSISDDYEKIFLENKKLEIDIVSKNEENEKMKKYIKDLEEQIKEKDMKYIENINNGIDVEEALYSQQLKNKTNNKINYDLESQNEIIDQLKEDIKEKDNEIEYLKIEIQELKSKIEEYEENFNSNSFKLNNEVNEKTNIFEEKIKFLTERNEYYQKLYSENQQKLNNLENTYNNLKKENEELKKDKNSENNISDLLKDQIIQNNDNKKYSSENYVILIDSKFKDLKWYLLADKNINELNEDNNKYNYDNLHWVPITNIIDLDKFNEYQGQKYNEENKNEEINEEKYTHKINNKEKEISFSSTVNNFSFHVSDDDNKNKVNQNFKRGSLFSLGNNNNIINEDNDYNKLLEKMKSVLEKLSKTEEKLMKFQKKYLKLKEKIKKSNNSNEYKISLSDDSNDLSNVNEIRIIENDDFDKLNLNRNIREHEYYESILIELDATKNQLNVVKKEFKELKKKFETVRQICEKLFSKINLKKKEKEEFKILLKVMDFADETISLIIDKKKK